MDVFRRDILESPKKGIIQSLFLSYRRSDYRGVFSIAGLAPRTEITGLLLLWGR
jgi:hypothetical protein